MKKITFVFLGILVVTLLISANLVIAEETTTTEEIDSTTVTESEVMDSHYGAQVRLLQLERALERRILWANAVINVIKDNGNDTTELESIVAELELLVDEVKEIPADATNQENVQKFIEIKSDARDLLKDFKDIAKQYLTAEDRQDLIEEFKQLDNTHIKELTQEIKENICLLNSERIEKLLEIMDQEDDELVDQVANCEIRFGQALKELKNTYKNLTDEQKQEVRQTLKSDYVKRRVLRANRISKIRENRLTRISERLQERADKLAETGFINASQRLQTLSDNLQVRAENIAKRREAIKEKLNK